MGREFMGVVLVGSLAYDSIRSPAGEVKDALGGSATYGGLSCQFHLKRINGQRAGLVGVVGTDFHPEDRAVLVNAGLDDSGLVVTDGATFRWEGAYHGSMSEAETLATHLNVFEHFQPQVPEHMRQPNVLFCANLHPAIQQSVMVQTQPRRLTMLDSMNLWINIARDELVEVMKQSDLVIINDGEVRMMMDDENVVRAMHALSALIHVPTLVVKRGEHGVLALHNGDLLALPAFPTSDLVDPTGCGDSFAGALAAHLSQSTDPLELSELREGLMIATVTASFTLERFGTDALQNLTEPQFSTRYEAYRRMLMG
jgi:hypothetical protein